MVQVSNHVTIVGPDERPVRVDESDPKWQKDFYTPGLKKSREVRGVSTTNVAYFLIEYRGLQFEPAPVELNDARVGRLAPNPEQQEHDLANHTQIVDFPAWKLTDIDAETRSGVPDGLDDQSANEVVFDAPASQEAAGAYDDFKIENMVCHYHRESEPGAFE